MADRQHGVPENVAGGVFVDRSCIDCDTCRRVAPAVFAAAGDHAFVHAQPGDVSARRAAARAQLACPVDAIGGCDPAQVRAAIGDFPQDIGDGIAWCGFTARGSFGASSWLVRRPGGNWLVDAPRWMPPLVERLEELGGIAAIFLTHADDVADAPRYAQRFAARMIIHERDGDAAPGAERLTGEDEIRLADDLLAIPVPGHTAGSTALLWRGAALFTGDHVWWSRHRGRLHASPEVNWHDWDQQVASIERLRPHPCRWLLPGHGDHVRFDDEAQRLQAFDELIAWARTQRG